MLFFLFRKSYIFWLFLFSKKFIISHEKSRKTNNLNSKTKLLLAKSQKNKHHLRVLSFQVRREWKSTKERSSNGVKLENHFDLTFVEYTLSPFVKTQKHFIKHHSIFWLVSSFIEWLIFLVEDGWCKWRARFPSGDYSLNLGGWGLIQLLEFLSNLIYLLQRILIQFYLFTSKFCC